MSAVFVLLLAVVIGAAAAVAGIAFIEGVNFFGGWFAAADFGVAAIFLPCAAGLCLAVISRFLPARHFLGLADMVLLVRRDIHHRFRAGLLSSLASFVALLGGASVGQYGAIAYLGGLLGVGVRRQLPANTAAACGIAAAIAAAFNAPIAGMVFAHEVVLRHYSLRAFTPVAVSAVVGYSVSVGVFAHPGFLQVESMTALHPAAVGLFVLLGLAYGVLATGYVRGIFWVADKTAKMSLFLRLPLAGLVTGLAVYALPELAGGDKGLLEAATRGLPGVAAGMLLALLVAKTAATAACLGGGFAGGAVSPTLVVGALAGLFFFRAADGLIALLPGSVPVSAVVLCGMMAMTAPVLGAPLAGILLVMELSGNYLVAVFAVVSIAVAMQTSARLGGRSYYDEQLRRRGFDMRRRRDEWLLQTTKVGGLASSAAVVLPPAATAAAAVRAATDKRAEEIYIVDDGVYVGRLSLAAALAALAADDAATLGSVADKQSPQLADDDSVETAIEKAGKCAEKKPTGNGRERAICRHRREGRFVAISHPHSTGIS